MPASSSRNGERRDRSVSTVTRWRPRVIATCSTRRSSSTSSARRWGSSPSDTPNTTTRSHSRPLTRWIVDSVTPFGIVLALERLAQPRLERRRHRGGGRRRPAGRRGRRGGSIPARCPSGRACSSPHRVRRRRGPSRGSPGSSPVRRASRRRRSPRPRSSARSSTLGSSLSPTCVASPASAPTVHVRRRPSRSGNHCGRPRVGPAQDLDDVARREPVGVGGDAQVGERGPQAGARQARPATASTAAGCRRRGARRGAPAGSSSPGRARRRSTARAPSRRRLPLRSASLRPSRTTWSAARAGIVGDHLESARGRVVVGSGDDLLGHPPVVVAEQGGRRRSTTSAGQR